MVLVIGSYASPGACDCHTHMYIHVHSVHMCLHDTQLVNIRWSRVLHASEALAKGGEQGGRPHEHCIATRVKCTCMLVIQCEQVSLPTSLKQLQEYLR